MSRRFRVWRLALLVLIIVTLVTPLTQAAAPKKVNIAFVPGWSQDAFYTTLIHDMQAAADVLGVNLITQVPSEWDQTIQTEVIDNVIALKDIDFLIVSPVQSYAVAMLKRAADAGIPMLTVDTFIGTGEYGKPDDRAGFPVSHIGTDNYQGGRLAAEVLGKALGGRGKVYIQNDSMGVSSLDERLRGFTEGLKGSPEMTVAGSNLCYGDGTVAQAQTATALKNAPDLAAIFATTDVGGLAAAEVVQKAGLTGRVKIVSFDATPALVEKLKAGAVDCILAQKPAEMAFFAVEMGLAYASGYTDVPKRISTGFVVMDKSNINDPDLARWIQMTPAK